MSRHPIAILVLVVAVALPAVPANAAPPGCTPGLDGGGVSCQGGYSGGSGGVAPPPASPPIFTPTPAGPSASPPASSSPGPSQPTNAVNVTQVANTGGQPCYYTGAVGTTGVSGATIGKLQALGGLAVLAYQPCPAQAGGAAPPPAAVAGAPPAPRPTPIQLAQRFWDTIRLPAPHPTTRPDFAVTGKPTYLTMGDAVDPPPWTRTTPFGTLAITARGSYTVTWGDGTTPTGPYRTPGAPYPSGTVTHTYDTTGVVSITVREQWTATWAIGGLHGVLRTLHTTGVDPGLAVRQIQAVITGSG